VKILVIDIETSPHLSFHWRRFKENIPPEYTVEESRVLCFAAKWVGEHDVHFHAEWEGGHKAMMKHAHTLLDEADAVVHFNGMKFDIKRLNTEFLLLGFDEPSPFKQIDLYLQSKKHFAFSSGKLKHILERLALTEKDPVGARMDLWIRTLSGDKEARRDMRKYNIQDVLSTEELYNYMLGWLRPHPNWGLFIDDVEDAESPVCPNCGSREVIKKGVEHTQVRSYQRWKCKACGKHSRGRKHIGAKGVDNGILR